MSARIFKPAKTAMSSGTAKTKAWVLEFLPAQARRIDPLMGWTSSSDMDSQVRLRFETVEAAKAYQKLGLPKRAQCFYLALQKAFAGELTQTKVTA